MNAKYEPEIKTEAVLNQYNNKNERWVWCKGEGVLSYASAGTFHEPVAHTSRLMDKLPTTRNSRISAPSVSSLGDSALPSRPAPRQKQEESHPGRQTPAQEDPAQEPRLSGAWEAMANLPFPAEQGPPGTGHAAPLRRSKMATGSGTRPGGEQRATHRRCCRCRCRRHCPSGCPARSRRSPRRPPR